MAEVGSLPCDPDLIIYAVMFTAFIISSVFYVNGKFYASEKSRKSTRDLILEITN